MPVPPEPTALVSRPSFRRRLLVTLGPALALALLLLGVVAWLFAYGWLTYSAQMILDAEIQEVAAQIVTPQGTLAPEAYPWHEPHHRFDARHIDPYFLQVFDARGHLLRASTNIGLFASDAYPSRLLAYETSADRLVQRLRTFEAADRLLYYRTEPVHDGSGRLLGYIQVARYVPGIAAIMKRTALFLLMGLVPVLLGLLGLVWWSARRVVAPLEWITKEAQILSPAHLDRRIVVPPIADRETALLATTLNRQLDLLERAFEEMRRFTADAAHELQTPLTVLQGHVDVTLRRERAPEAYRETLRVLHTEIEGLIRMVRSLLQLARLDREDKRLPSEPVDLVAAVRREAARFRREAEAKGLGFSLNLPDDAWVDGQPDLVHEVVINLLDNAVKYTERGSIQVSVHQQEGTVMLAVEDTGIGMPEEVRRHATDRFYRAPTADAQSIPGSGLGLSLVAQIVAKHRGQLTIDSAPHRGTLVQVTFPAAVRTAVHPV